MLWRSVCAWLCIMLCWDANSSSPVLSFHWGSHLPWWLLYASSKLQPHWGVYRTKWLCFVWKRNRKNSTFQESARQAIEQAIAHPPNNNGYAMSKVIVPGTTNESAYVLADCWRTLNASSCRACLEMRRHQYWDACLGLKGGHWTQGASWGTQIQISSTKNQIMEVQQVNYRAFFLHSVVMFHAITFIVFDYATSYV